MERDILDTLKMPLSTDNVHTGRTVGLYVHVPFCERKCEYCDFYSIESRELLGRFVESVRREIADGAIRCAGCSVDTVYVGGGTPSLLSAGQVASIMDVIRAGYRLEQDVEVTLEVNPGTVDFPALEALRRVGINRLSMGVQSFDDGELRFLGRMHSAADARACIVAARKAGFDNLSLDCIYSLPGQTPERWRQTLEEAVGFAPEHLSAYSLIVEEDTPLFRSVQEGRVVPNSDSAEAELYELTMEFLKAHGYEHYEVSNYAQPGFRSRHNSRYWHHESYLGFGPAAHSFWLSNRTTSAQRWSNSANVAAYCDLLFRGESPVSITETLSKRDLINERIFLGLRSDGLDLDTLHEDLGYSLSGRQEDTVRGLVQAGHVMVDGRRLRLTPRGYVICDEICTRLLLP
jgi:oxygen-independent coproporphyrinogen-3 oxidase